MKLNEIEAHKKESLGRRKKTRSSPIQLKILRLTGKFEQKP
jgi:hypothetical protein